METCTAIQAKRDDILAYFEKDSFISTQWFWANGSGAWFICKNDYYVTLNSCE